MAQARLVPVFVIILVLVLTPFLTISGESSSSGAAAPENPDQPGVSSRPDDPLYRASPFSRRHSRRFRQFASKSSNQSAVFFNPKTYLSGGVYAFSVAVGDFNGDGKMDLAVANQCPQNNCTAGAVSVLLGNGDGTFQAAQSYSTGGYEAYAVAVGDVNNDGKADLIVDQRMPDCQPMRERFCWRFAGQWRWDISIRAVVLVRRSRSLLGRDCGCE